MSSSSEFLVSSFRFQVQCPIPYSRFQIPKPYLKFITQHPRSKRACAVIARKPGDMWLTRQSQGAQRLQRSRFAEIASPPSQLAMTAQFPASPCPPSRPCSPSPCPRVSSSLPTRPCSPSPPHALSPFRPLALSNTNPRVAPIIAAAMMCQVPPIKRENTMDRQADTTAITT